jgi:hypothetical protein
MSADWAPPRVEFFDNGYGISVINIHTNSMAYGTEDAPYELAVLKGNEHSAVLCYDTPITEDVIGHLTENAVDWLAVKVAALPPA